MPVPTALVSSQAGNNNLAAVKARRAHLAHHQVPYYSRSANAPLSKGAGAHLTAQEAFLFSDQMAITAGHNHSRLGRARAVVEDENTPFDAHYAHGGPQYSNSKLRPLTHDVLGPVPSDFHVRLDAAAGRRGADHRQRRHQQHYRHSLSSWPPSPQGLPPTPTFDDDVYRGSEMDITGHHDSVQIVWPPAPPAPNERIFGESSLISGGGPGSYRAPAAPESVPEALGAAVGSDGFSPASDIDPAKLVPSPGELLRIANEQARANAATNLSDWISEVVWEMSIPLMNGHPSSSPNSSSLRRSASLSSNNLVPPPFKRFAQQTIYQVSASAGSLFLAVWYIRRLPIGPLITALGERVAFSDHENAFREDLLSTRSEIPWRLLVLGLTLSNKWLEDNTFTTKTWNEVTGLSVPLMRSVESKALGLFNWVLSPKPDEWLEFLQYLRAREVASNMLNMPNAIGSERRSSLSMSASYSESSPSKRPIRVIDELMAEVRATVGSFDPVFPGVSPSLSPSGSSFHAGSSPISPATSIAESFGTVSSARSQPRPLSPPHVENTWNSRPASWAEPRHDFSGDEIHTHVSRAMSEDLVARFGVLRPRRINTPAAWDPSASVLDSPIIRDEMMLRKTRPMYEAVQRPYPTSSSLLLIPPPPSFDDYSNASFVPRAKYEEDANLLVKDVMMESQDVGSAYPPMQSFPEHYESQGMDRSWYDSKFPRNMMPVETHRGSWAATFAGMISSF